MLIAILILFFFLGAGMAVFAGKIDARNARIYLQIRQKIAAKPEAENSHPDMYYRNPFNSVIGIWLNRIIGTALAALALYFLIRLVLNGISQT